MGDLVQFSPAPQTKDLKEAKLAAAVDGIELLSVFVTITDPSERRRIIAFARAVALESNDA
jgi:hypothetical protein